MLLGKGGGDGPPAKACTIGAGVEDEGEELLGGGAASGGVAGGQPTMCDAWLRKAEREGWDELRDELRAATWKEGDEVLPSSLSSSITPPIAAPPDIGKTRRGAGAGDGARSRALCANGRTACCA